MSTPQPQGPPPKSIGGEAPTRPVVPEPRSVGQLEKVVRRYTRAHGIAEKRVRDWIAYMAIGGALERAARSAQHGADGDGATSVSPAFTFRGGIALELRLQGTARATKDLDITYTGPETDLAIAIEDALSLGYERFTFQRTGRVLDMDRVRTIRLEIAVRFDGEPWTTVVMDVSRNEAHALEVETVPAFDLEGIFGIAGPRELPCLSLRYHLAHKFHGATAEREDGLPNERVQDAIDLLLFREMVTDLAALREACVEVFTTRARHAWPPRFDPPAAWALEFSRLAAEVGLEVRELNEAIERIRAFIDEIEPNGAAGASVAGEGVVPPVTAG